MGLQQGLLTGVATETKQDEVLAELDLLNSNTPKNYQQEVVLGFIVGQSMSAQAGNNPGVSANNLESINNLRLESGTGFVRDYLTSNTQFYISSSDPADVGQVIGIPGVDEDFNPVFRLVTTNGQTPVPISDLMMIPGLMFMIPPLSDAVGNIYLSSDNTDITNGVPNTLENVFLKIDKGFSQGVGGNFVIPAGKIGYLEDIIFNSSKVADSDINLRFGVFPVGDPTKAPPFQVFQGTEAINQLIGSALPEKTTIDAVVNSPVEGAITWAFKVNIIDP